MYETKITKFCNFCKTIFTSYPTLLLKNIGSTETIYKTNGDYFSTSTLLLHKQKTQLVRIFPYFIAKFMEISHDSVSNKNSLNYDALSILVMYQVYFSMQFASKFFQGLIFRYFNKFQKRQIQLGLPIKICRYDHFLPDSWTTFQLLFIITVYTVYYFSSSSYYVLLE